MSVAFIYYKFSSYIWKDTKFITVGNLKNNGLIQNTNSLYTNMILFMKKEKTEKQEYKFLLVVVL